MQVSRQRQKDVQRYLENWQEEIDSAAQYHAMASSEENPKISLVYENLAKVEEKHVSFWEDQLRKVGKPIPQRKPSWRSRVLVWLAKYLGPRAVLPTLASAEQLGRDSYALQPESRKTLMSQQEHWHARVLHQLIKTQPHGVSGGTLGRLEGRHRLVGGNALRASVLGANDGLCSNLSLVMGVAGASISSHGILISGIAGLLAGASSMAIGEWLSVKSARELAEREIRIESNELDADPEAEGEELQLIYESKGLSSEEARSLSRQMLSNKATALDTLSREELGIDPQELGGSPWVAAVVSFVLFSAGAAIPVLPFFFLSNSHAVLASIGLSSLMLFFIGAGITIFTGRSIWISGARQLLLGLTAAVLTFFVGSFLGARL